jgi:hypothetical protein
MWMLEPVISTLVMRSSVIDTRAAKEKYMPLLKVVEPMSMTSSEPLAIGEELKGRWAGWIMAQAMKDNDMGTAECMNCNLSGNSIFFSISCRGMRTVHNVMTPMTLEMIAHQCKTICMNMGASASISSYNSTKINIQTAVDAPRSGSLKMFGNGSVQYCGSPKDIDLLVRCMIASIKECVDMHMIEFLKTLRISDMNA